MGGGNAEENVAFEDKDGAGGSRGGGPGRNAREKSATLTRRQVRPGGPRCRKLPRDEPLLRIGTRIPIDAGRFGGADGNSGEGNDDA